MPVLACLRTRCCTGGVVKLLLLGKVDLCELGSTERVQKMMEGMEMIREWLRTAKSHQKSYTNKRRSNLEFNVGAFWRRVWENLWWLEETRGEIDREKCNRSSGIDCYRVPIMSQVAFSANAGKPRDLTPRPDPTTLDIQVPPGRLKGRAWLEAPIYSMAQLNYVKEMEVKEESQASKSKSKHLIEKSKIRHCFFASPRISRVFAVPKTRKVTIIIPIFGLSSKKTRNRKGLLEFASYFGEGQRWKFYRLPGKDTNSSLIIDRGRSEAIPRSNQRVLDVVRRALKITMDSDDEIRYERDWDKTKRLEREKADLTTQLARAVAQFKEKELHMKNHIKEQELQMKNQIKEKELQMKNQIKEKELDFEKQITRQSFNIKESSKIIQFLDEKLHKIGYFRMSTRFPILKGFEMGEEFSEMQEMKKHDPLFQVDKYHRVKFVYNSDTLRIKSKDSSNSSDFLVYPDITSSQESDIEAKPYVPTLVLEKKIVDLENLLKTTQSEYESLRIEEKAEHNAEREKLLEQIKSQQKALNDSEHDMILERYRFVKEREEYVRDIFELKKTASDLQKLLDDRSEKEKTSVDPTFEELTKTVSDLQNTLTKERKVFDLKSVNLSKKISELERKIVLDKKNFLKKPSLRVGKYQNMMHEFEEEIQVVKSERKSDEQKTDELQQQIVDLQNQLSDVRQQFKRKEKVLQHEKTVLEQIIAEPKKPSLVEKDFEDQKEAFKAEIRKLTSKLSELSTDIMNGQQIRSDQQKKLHDLLEERNKLSSKVKELEMIVFNAHNSFPANVATRSNINSSGQIRSSNLFYDRHIDYSEVSMINPEPEDLPKEHIPRLDLVCEGVHEMNIETRHGPSVDNSCHPTKLLKYLSKDVCFNSHGELAHHLSNLHSEDLDIEKGRHPLRSPNFIFYTQESIDYQSVSQYQELKMKTFEEHSDGGLRGNMNEEEYLMKSLKEESKD
ncbi:hypothetical protein OSB04_002370 [Centaurea solstitialis]|uniref:Uncharacterized protein n=1 Tax=Centaurea solstitialis TaxID=347529 RepID=A0AA38WUU3_9ASTR|nr:hypothetical protein OSB04_002370 [Centaurea solstitialis]